MTTEPLPHPTVVWVTVDWVNRPKTQWSYLLPETKPDNAWSGRLHDLRIPTDKSFRTYTELCAWLETHGCATPPPDYFTPTREELDEHAQWICLRVVHPR